MLGYRFRRRGARRRTSATATTRWGPVSAGLAASSKHFAEPRWAWSICRRPSGSREDRGGRSSSRGGRHGICRTAGSCRAPPVSGDPVGLSPGPRAAYRAHADVGMSPCYVAGGRNGSRAWSPRPAATSCIEKLRTGHPRRIPRPRPSCQHGIEQCRIALAPSGNDGTATDQHFAPTCAPQGMTGAILTRAGKPRQKGVDSAS